MKFLKSHPLGAVAGAVLLIGTAVMLLGAYSPRPALPKPLESFNATVEQGRYLATAANCATCHTREGGTPYAGGVEFHTPFGLLYSTNITPDEESGIGAWSFEDFYRSMKYGVRPGGAHLYPAFPYTAYAKMSDEDIASIYLYMQTLEPAEAQATANDMRFPFNQRALLGFWKRLFHDPAGFQPDPGQSETWNRGAYLVQGPGHCGACHTPRNAMGAERQDLGLTGAVYMDRVKRGYYREWSTVNLTPSERGLAAWSKDDIVNYLRDGKNAHTVVHGPMNDVIVNSTHHLHEDDLRAMATYLKGIPANARNPNLPAPSNEMMAAGKIGYTVHCGSCHLPSGRGDPVLGVPLAGNTIVQAADPQTLINVILYGPDLPAREFVDDRIRMKMFGKRLSDQDIANIATYVRSSFGNRAGAVTPEQVNKQR